MISLRSSLTRKILNYFFINPHESLYVNELSRNLHLDKRNLVKKLRELETEGILKSEKRGNLKLYTINKRYPLFDEYKKIILKTVGFEEQLRNILKHIDGITGSYIYGSYAQNKMETHSDIDILVIGTHNIIDLHKKILKLQREIGREINIVNMDPQEYKKRIGNKDPFITEVMKRTYIKV